VGCRRAGGPKPSRDWQLSPCRWALPQQLDAEAAPKSRAIAVDVDELLWQDTTMTTGPCGESSGRQMNSPGFKALIAATPAAKPARCEVKKMKRYQTHDPPARHRH